MTAKDYYTEKQVFKKGKKSFRMIGYGRGLGELQLGVGQQNYGEGLDCPEPSSLWVPRAKDLGMILQPQDDHTPTHSGLAWILCELCIAVMQPQQRRAVVGAPHRDGTDRMSKRMGCNRAGHLMRERQMTETTQSSQPCPSDLIPPNNHAMEPGSPW